MSRSRTLVAGILQATMVAAVALASSDTWAQAAEGSALATAPADADAHKRAVDACFINYLACVCLPDDERIQLAARARGELAGAVAGGPTLSTGHTGLLMGALARCHAELGEPGSAEAAQRLQTLLRTTAWDDARGLSGGSALPDAPATARDHVDLIHGLLTVYQASGRIESLVWAVDLQDRLDHASWNEALALYGTGGPGDLTATALSALDLVRLGHITDDDAFAARAARILDAHPPDPDGADSMASFNLLTKAGMERASPILHLIIIGAAEEPGTVALLRAAHRLAVPGFAIAILDEGTASKALRKRFPGMPLMPRLAGGRPTAYLCTAKECDTPTTDPDTLAKRIGELAGR